MKQNSSARLFPGFVVVGTIGFIVDAGVFQLLFETIGGYVLTRLLATAIAIVVTWYLNRRFVFRTSNTPGRGAEFLKYVTVQSGGIVTNFAVYALLLATIPFLRTIPVIAVAAGSLCAMGLNFAGSKRWAFVAAYDHDKEANHE